MAVSVFELFKIGIGPSSSHTVGPMRAACTFVNRLLDSEPIDDLHRIQVTLFGSLAKYLVVHMLGEEQKVH